MLDKSRIGIRLQYKENECLRVANFKEIPTCVLKSGPDLGTLSQSDKTPRGQTH